jgi:hypothetical protein
MAPLGMASRHPEQARDRILGNVDQTGGGSHPAYFAQMIDDGRRLFFRDLCSAQSSAV